MSLQYVDLTPSPETPADTGATTRYRLLPSQVDCPVCPIEVCETCCPAELGAPHYVADGDDIHLQFFFEDLVNSDPENPTLGWRKTGDSPGDYWLELGLYDQNGNLVSANIDFFADAWSVWHNGSQSVQNVVIKLGTRFENYSCFHFCVKIFSPSLVEYITVELVTGALPDSSGYEEGDTILVGDVLYTIVNGAWKGNGVQEPGTLVYEATTGQWYTVTSPGLVEKIERPEVVSNPTGVSTNCCTAPYRKILCESSVEVCTDRTSGKDCKGRDYSRPTGGVLGGSRSSQFQYCKRFPGSLEPIAYPVTRELSEDGVLIQGGYSERARLRTSGICRYDAEDIAAVLGSEGFTIDGEIWDTVTDVERNNENGILWYLDITLGREICEGTKDCNFSFE